MKKKKIKNRKRELRLKRLFIGSIIVSILFISFSVSIFFYRVLLPKNYITPLSVMIGKNISQVKSSNLDFVDQVKQMLGKENISYTDIRLSDQNTCQIALNGQEQVLIATNKDIYGQIASLQLIVSRLTMEGKRFSRLDLRFDKPVIIFVQ